jgi:hypothetical protein
MIRNGQSLARPFAKIERLNCSGHVWSLKMVGGRATDVRLEPFSLGGLSSFAQDAAGELYLMSVDSGDLNKLVGP